MKKLFLSSGIVLCLMSPVFATGISVVNGELEEADCDHDTLGVYSGSVSLEAEWIPNIGTITLVSNVYPSNNTSSTPLYAVSGTAATNASPRVTAASPSTLYSVYGVGVYTTQPNSSTLSSYTTSNRLSNLTSAQNGAIPSVTGYDFQGFYASDGTTQLINSSGAIQYDTASTQITASNGSAIWYAHWSAKTYTVTYDAGAHGSGSYSHTDGATFDQNYTVPAAANSAITADNGYTFVGFNTATGQTTSNFPDSQETPWKRTDNLTVYAAYTANTGTLSYNCGTQPGSTSLAAGGAAPTGGTLTYGQSFTLATTPGTCAYQGYTFAGWSCNYNLAEGTANNLTGDAINYPATNGTIASGHTGTYSVTTQGVSVSCTARWTANEIILDWDVNGGTAGSTPGGTSCFYDGDILLPSNPTRTGYTFTGWQVTS